MKKLMLGVVVVSVGVAALAAVGQGEESGLPAKLDRDTVTVPTHRVGAPGAPGASASAISRSAKSKKPKVKPTVQSDPIPISPGISDAFAVACPKKYEAINGYYGTDGGIFPDLFAPNLDAKREWLFGFTNPRPLDGRIILGAVCAKNL